MGFWDKLFGKKQEAPLSPGVRPSSNSPALSPGTPPPSTSKRPKWVYSETFLQQRIDEIVQSGNPNSLNLIYWGIQNALKNKNKSEEAQGLFTLASILEHSGNPEPTPYEEAILYCKVALTILNQIGVVRLQLLNRPVDLKTEVTKCLNGVFSRAGLAYLNKGWSHEALEVFHEHLQFAKTNQSLQAQTLIMGNMAIAYRQLKQWQRAYQIIDQALLIARKANDRGEEIELLSIKAFTLKEEGRNHDAIAAYSQIQILANKQGTPKQIISAYIQQALCQIAIPQNNEALPNFEKALGYARSTGDQALVADVAIDIGKKLSASNPLEANRFIIIGFNYLQSTGEMRRAGAGAMMMAQNFQRLSQWAEALHYAQLGERILIRSGDQQLLDMVRHMKEQILDERIF